MKWLVLRYSELYFEETKYKLVKFYQFSCTQEYYNLHAPTFFGWNWPSGSEEDYIFEFRQCIFAIM